MAAAIRNKQDLFSLLGIDYIISPLKVLHVTFVAGSPSFNHFKIFVTLDINPNQLFHVLFHIKFMYKLRIREKYIIYDFKDIFRN